MPTYYKIPRGFDLSPIMKFLGEQENLLQVKDSFSFFIPNNSNFIYAAFQDEKMSDTFQTEMTRAKILAEKTSKEDFAVSTEPDGRVIGSNQCHQQSLN